MSADPPAGWYPDPDDPAGQRYWDGVAWTPHTAPGPAAGAAASVAPQLNTWTWQSFLVTVFCGGTIVSMVGIWNAGKAEGALRSGDLETARTYARRARNWTLGGLALGVVAILAVFVGIAALGIGAQLTDCSGVTPADGVRYDFCQAYCEDPAFAEDCRGFEG